MADPYPLFDPLISRIQTVEEKEMWYLSQRGAKAIATFSSEGLVVHKGSLCSKNITPSAQAAPFIKRREALIKEKIIANTGDRLEFTEDFQFKSPSGAAAILCGSFINGWIVWKNRDGKTLKEIKRAE